MQLKPGDKTLIALIIAIILSYLIWYNVSAIITTSYMGYMWELYGFWGWIGPFMVSATAAVGYEYTRASTIGGRLAAIIILIGAPAVWLMGKVSDKIGRTKTIIICSISSLTRQLIFGFLQ